MVSRSLVVAFGIMSLDLDKCINSRLLESIRIDLEWDFQHLFTANYFTSHDSQVIHYLNDKSTNSSHLDLWFHKLFSRLLDALEIDWS
jgi:hypothetical protein